jgi:hypothetical protein
MSDPYADTVTVRNILNHILSPKVVSDGNGGYTTKVDLVNVDTFQFSSQQSGVFVYDGGGATTLSVFIFTIPVSNTVLHRSIPFVQVTAHDDTMPLLYVIRSQAGDGVITVVTNIQPTSGDTFSWFIARF